jgi:acyl dehydratase
MALDLDVVGAEFTRPVLPGDTLEVSIWADGERGWFQTAVAGRVVLDHGRFTVAGGPS